MEEQDQNQNQNSTNDIKEPEIVIEKKKEVEDEKAPVGLKVLSFFIPLAGLIIFAVKYDENPRYAKGCGICALIGFFTLPLIIILSFLLTMFIILFIASAAANSSNAVMDDKPSIVEYSIENFNNMFEIYAGTQSYASVRTLMNTVNTHNLTEKNHEVKVMFDGREKTASEVRSAVSPNNSYRVRFHYDLSGYIDEVKVNTIR